MHKSASSFNKETSAKNITFLSLAIPLFISLWITISLFGNFINPKDFFHLPQNIREEHVTSLFFRGDSWHFPITLIKNINQTIPLSLTDTIPLIAIIFKIFKIETMQYFGIWMILSYTLFVFFAYRISKNIFPNSTIAAGLGSLLFLSLPVIWYHSFFVPWFAGQWIILWALSLFFKKKIFTSLEWYGLLIIASLIHPYFVVICFLIMLADIFHLYIYNHSISSLIAASTVSHLLTTTFFTLSIAGMFFLPSYRQDIPKIFPLSFHKNIVNTYNISFLDIGLGCIIGFIASLMFILNEGKIKTYIKFYRPLFLSMFLLFLFSVSGGIEINNYTFDIPNKSWIKLYIVPLLTSGPRYFIPILYLIVITIIHLAYHMEKNKKFFGFGFLGLCITLQMMVFSIEKFPDIEPFIKFDKTGLKFIESAKNFQWIYTENIDQRPIEFDILGYFAFKNKIGINAVPTIRFPTNYKNHLKKDSLNFIKKEFNPETIYILKKNFNLFDLSKYGRIYILRDAILFRCYEKILI